MWQWLKNKIGGKSKKKSIQDEIHLDEAGIYCLNWMSRSKQWPVLWRWNVILEFGFSFHEAIFPDPWFGKYMEAQWFFTVENTDGPQRVFFEADTFSADKLPDLLLQKLSGLDVEVLKEGWRQYRIGERNFKGAGQWLAWKSEGFNWQK